MSGPSMLELGAGLLFDSAVQSTLLLGIGMGVQQVLPAVPAATRHTIWAVTLASLPVSVGVLLWLGLSSASTWTWMLGIWAVGTLAIVLRHGVGWLRLWRLGRAAQLHADGVWAVYTDGPVPFTWGVLRPVIAIPRRLSHSAARLDAALAHERAHVDRHDWLVHMLAHLVCAVFWFQPLVWWARASLEQQAEHAADDAVLEAGVRPSTYATWLVELAGHPPAGALGVARSSVGKRVLAVLSTHQRRGRTHCARWPVAMAASLVVAGVLSGSTRLGWAAPSPPPLGCSPTVDGDRWHPPLRP